MPQALAFAIQLISALPALLRAGKDITTLVNDGLSALETMQREGRDPNPVEWNRLNNQIAALRHALHSDAPV